MTDPAAPQVERVDALRAQPPSHIVDLAIQVSTWSPCRSKRGVVIFSGDDVLSHGYNSKPQGFDCDGSEACKATCRLEAIHAEQRALLRLRSPQACEMLHVKTIDGALVPSGGPSCVECSKLLMLARVQAVWLYHAHGWQRYEIAEFHRLSLAALLGGRTPDRQLELRTAIKTFRSEMRGHFSNLPTGYAREQAMASFENHIANLFLGHCDCFGSRDCPHGPPGAKGDQ